MAWNSHGYDGVPGTYVFNGRRAALGYDLNRMCMSFNDARNREAFRQDEEGYCDRFDLTPEQREGIRARGVLVVDNVAVASRRVAETEQLQAVANPA